MGNLGLLFGAIRLPFGFEFALGWFLDDSWVCFGWRFLMISCLDLVLWWFFDCFGCGCWWFWILLMLPVLCRGAI